MALATACCVLLVWFSAAGKAEAAEFSKDPRPDCDFVMKGRIDKGDFAKFKAFLGSAGLKQRWDHKTGFCLNSPGGNLAAALEIAEKVYETGYTTVVNSGDRCLSACAFIFMMGMYYEGEVSSISRKLHVHGVLGFHRPMISIQPGRYSSKLVAKSFDVAIESVLKIVELANQTQINGNVIMIKPSMLREILAHRGADFLYIDKTGQAGQWNIEVFGANIRIRSIDKQIAYDICVNTTFWEMNSRDANHIATGFHPSQIKRVRIAGKPGVTGYYVSVPGEDAPGFQCLMYLDNDPSRSLFIVSGERCSVPLDSENTVDPDKLSPCYFSSVTIAGNEILFFKKDTKIAALRAARSVQSSEDAGGYTSYSREYAASDIVGKDLKIFRNEEQWTCGEKCLKDADCKAYTYDQWNKVCILKATAERIRLDPRAYSQAKADRDLPQVSTLIRFQSRANRKFPGYSYKKFEGLSATLCRGQCELENKCLGYNYAAAGSRCELFESPAEYQPAAGVEIGFKVQFE